MQVIKSDLQIHRIIRCYYKYIYKYKCKNEKVIIKIIALTSL